MQIKLQDKEEITIIDKNGLEVHSYSRLKLWGFCNQAHFFRYVEKIEPMVTARPLKFGSHLHALLAADKGAEPVEAVLERVDKEYQAMFVEEREFYGNLPEDLRTVFGGYKKFWEVEDLYYVYHLVEAELGPVPLTKYTSLTIRPDRVAQDIRNGKEFLFETKTGKSIPSEDYRLWDMQTFLYIWGMRELGHNIDGIIWDHVRSKVPTIPQALKKGGLSQAKNIDTTYDVYYKAILDNGLNPDDYEEFLKSLVGKENKFYRRVKLPVKENMLLPVVEGARRTSLEIYHLGKCTPVKNISRNTCGMCSFRPICEAELLDLDVDYVKETQFRPRPPREGEEVGSEEETTED